MPTRTHLKCLQNKILLHKEISNKIRKFSWAIITSQLIFTNVHDLCVLWSFLLATVCYAQATSVYIIV